MTVSSVKQSGAGDPFGLVGTIVERKYLVDGAVAEGGFGVVYHGQHMGLGIPVAIKLLKSDDEPNPSQRAEAVSRFVQEAHNVARLRHPNIVNVLDTGELFVPTNGHTAPFIVFEWLDGPTLSQDMAGRKERRTLAEAMSLWRPVCEAIAFAHQARVVHRDLKPNNVIIVRGAEGQAIPKVLDFGIAKPLDRSTQTPETTRTNSARRAFSLAHAAPEQLAGTRTGPWTDVHALGLLFVEMLVNRPPYGTGDSEERYARAFGPERPTPGRFGIDVGSLEVVLARALALKPRQRYRDARELLKAVDAALKQYPDAESPRTDPRGSASESVGAASSSLTQESTSQAPDAIGVATNSTERATVQTNRSRAGQSRVLLLAIGSTALVSLATSFWWTRRQPPKEPAATISAPTGSPHGSLGLSAPSRGSTSVERTTTEESSRSPARGIAPVDTSNAKAPLSADPRSLARDSSARSARSKSKSIAQWDVKSSVRASAPSSGSPNRERESTAPQAAGVSSIITTPGIPAPYVLE